MAVVGRKVSGITRPTNTGGQDAQQIISEMLSGVDVGGYDFSGLGGGSTSNPNTGVGSILSGKAALLNAGTNADKFAYTQGQDAYAQQLAASQLAAKKKALLGLYNTNGGYDLTGILNSIQGIEDTSAQGIEGQLSSSLAGVGEGYNAASDLMNQGYSGLDEYLANNQKNAYSNVTAQGATVQNDLQNLLQGQGAMSPNVESYLQGVNANLASSQSQFQNLLNTLASIETSGQESRKKEAKMSRTSATTGLGQQRAGAEAQLRAGANQALVQLATQMAQQRLAAEQQSASNKASIAQILAEAGIDINPEKVTPVEDNPADGFTFDPTLLPDFSNLDWLGGANFGSGFLTR